MSLFAKQRQTHRLQNYDLWKGVTQGDKLGIWDGHIHTTIYKIDHQQGPTV